MRVVPVTDVVTQTGRVHFERALFLELRLLARSTIQRLDEDRARSLRARAASLAPKRACCGLSRSSTPSSSPPRSSGITISEFDAESQAMWTGKGVHVLDEHRAASLRPPYRTPLAERDAHARRLALERARGPARHSYISRSPPS